MDFAGAWPILRPVPGEKNPRLRFGAKKNLRWCKKSRHLANGADFFLRSNKSRLCTMKMFISRECDWIPVGGSLYSPRSVHREGRYFARRSKGGTGCGTRVRGSLPLTPGHIQRAAAG